MKQLISILLMMLSSASTIQAQFVVTDGSILVQSGSTFTIDSLSMLTTANMTITNSQINHTYVNEAVNTGNTINSVYAFTNPVTFTGTLQLKYTVAQLAGNTESALQVIRTAANSPLIWLTTAGSMVNTSTKVVSGTFAGVPMGRMSASSVTVPLPVTLLAFDAQKGKYRKTALITWQVANEDNLLRYEVERGQDALHFSKLGSVTATGSRDYELYDMNPESGWNYYRLKMIDNDGSFAYSMARKLSFDDAVYETKVFPNPFSTQITIHTNDQSLESTRGAVTDVAGRLVTSFTLKSNATTLDANSWAAGMYLIKLANGVSFKVQKN